MEDFIDISWIILKSFQAKSGVPPITIAATLSFRLKTRLANVLEIAQYAIHLIPDVFPRIIPDVLISLSTPQSLSMSVSSQLSKFCLEDWAKSTE